MLFFAGYVSQSWFSCDTAHSYQTLNGTESPLNNSFISIFILFLPLSLRHICVLISQAFTLLTPLYLHHAVQLKPASRRDKGGHH